jgi:putative transposase
MKFAIGNFYHVFNRGNNRQVIFPQKRNYAFSLSKLKSFVREHCHIVAYCLMPDHFHTMLYLDESSSGLGTKSKPLLQVLEQRLGTLQSSYTRAINNRENRTGSLCQTKIKVIEMDSAHSSTCFHYIHQNPLKANLVHEFSEWAYSSYLEYFCLADEICNKEIAFKLLEIPSNPAAFAKLSKEVVVNEEAISKINFSRQATPSGLAIRPL